MMSRITTGLPFYYKHSDKMETFLLDFYEKMVSESVWDETFYKYWTVRYDLMCDFPDFYKDWEDDGEMHFGAFDVQDDTGRSGERDRLCNMGTFTNIDPRMLVIQDHSKVDGGGNHELATKQLKNPIVRRFYLSFISAAREEVRGPVEVKHKLQDKIYSTNGKSWAAQPTPWEEYLALFFILKNEFIRYESKRFGVNVREHTFQQMREDWMPYRTSWFCEELWRFLENAPDYLMNVYDWDYCGADEIEIIKPKFKDLSYLGDPDYQKGLGTSEIFQWVERVLDNVEWMENALPSEYRMQMELEKG